MKVQVLVKSSWILVCPHGFLFNFSHFRCNPADLYSVHFQMQRQQSSMSVLVAQLCPTLWTIDHQTHSMSMEFSRQEYWSGLPFPSPNSFL